MKNDNVFKYKKLCDSYYKILKIIFFIQFILYFISFSIITLVKMNKYTFIKFV